MSKDGERALELLQDPGICEQLGSCQSEEEVLEIMRANGIEMESLDEFKERLQAEISEAQESGADLNGWNFCLPIIGFGNNPMAGICCGPGTTTEGVGFGGLGTACAYVGFSLGPLISVEKDW